MKILIVHGSGTEAATRETLSRHGGDGLVLLQTDAFASGPWLPGDAERRIFESYLSPEELLEIDRAALRLSREWFLADGEDLSVEGGVPLGLVFQEELIMGSVPLLKNIACATRALEREKPDRVYVGRGVGLVPGAWKAVAEGLGVECLDLRSAGEALGRDGDTPLASAPVRSLRPRRRMLSPVLHGARRMWRVLREGAEDRSIAPLVLVVRSPYNAWLWPELASSSRVRFRAFDIGSQPPYLRPRRPSAILDHCQARFRQRWATLVAARGRNPALTFQGVDLWDFLAERLEELFKTGLPAHAIEAATAEGTLRWRRPVLVMAPYLPYAGRAKLYSLVARKLGIPVACVQHETMLPRYLSHYEVVIADYAVAWGDIGRQWFVTQGMDADRVFVSRPNGLPDSSGSESTREDAPPGRRRPRVLVAATYWGPWTAWYSPLDFESALVAVGDVAALLPAYDFIVKFHPSTANPVHEGADALDRKTALLRSRELPNLSVAPLRSRLADYLPSCSVMIAWTSFSTTVIESLYLGKPVIVFDGTNKEELLPEVKASGAVLFAYDVAGLAGAIRRVVEDPAAGRALVDRRDHLLETLVAKEHRHREVLETLALGLARVRSGADVGTTGRRARRMRRAAANPAWFASRVVCRLAGLAWRTIPGSSRLEPWGDPLHIARRLLRRAMEERAHYVRGRALDVGCGDRPYEGLFREVGRYVGLDVPPNRHVDVHADGQALPFRDASFDSVLCNEVLEHVPEPGRLMAEARRVLKPGGFLLLTAPLTWGLHLEPHDFYRYTKYGLRYLAESSGFEVIEVSPTCGIWATLAQRLSDSVVYTFAAKRPRWTLRLLCALLAPVLMLGYGLDVLSGKRGDTLDYVMVARASRVSVSPER